MADLIKHSEIVQKLLQDYAALSGDDPAVAIDLIFDTVRDSYQLVHVGWHDDRLRIDQTYKINRKLNLVKLCR
jgi:XisI protein